MLRRITPQEVLEAYRKAGLKARTYDFRKGTGEACCGLGAVMYAQGVAVDDLTDSFEVVGLTLGLPRDYVAGFTAGFDGGRTSPYLGDDPDRLARELGRQDGVAARDAVTEAGLWLNGRD